MMWGYDNNLGGSNQGWFMVAMMVFWIAVIFVAVLLVIRMSGHRHDNHMGHHQHYGESPRSILDRRLANGEITADQYKEAKGHLGI
jgi:uncharacterized membrane protein